MSNKAILRFLAGFFAVVALLLGVVLYLTLPGGGGRVPPGAPVRTAVWLADSERPHAERRDVIILVEEVPGAPLVALTLPARMEGTDLVPGRRGGKEAATDLGRTLGRRIHHYLVLSEPALRRLVTMTGGIDTAAGTLTPAAAIAYVFGEPSTRLRLQRAPEVLWGLADRALAGQVKAGAGDLLALASALETDLRLSRLQEVLGRWSAERPAVQPAPGQEQNGDWKLNRTQLDALLRADPVP